jgi:hypothetical protein
VAADTAGRTHQIAVRTINVKLVREQRCQACGRINCTIEYDTMLCINTCFSNYLEAEQKVARIIIAYAAAIMRRPDGVMTGDGRHSKSRLREIVSSAQTLLGLTERK